MTPDARQRAIREALAAAIHDTLYHGMARDGRWYWQTDKATPQDLADAVMARLAFPSSGASPEHATPPAPDLRAALDVDRLARAIKWITEGTPGWLAGVDQVNGMSDVTGLAKALAAEYAALAAQAETGEDR